MAETHILGVDFSGAQSDKNTWITEGWLTGGALHIERCRSIKRNVLTDFLKTLGSNAVAALDFPFGVPLDFANVLAPEAHTMPEVWAAVGDMCLDDFIDQRNRFVGDPRQGELLRAGDIHFPGCYSCLHDVNPNMVPMTYYGMKMLNKLRGFYGEVPPLPKEGRDGPVLLETMPGAILWSLKLPAKNSGKSYKTAKDALERRREILNGLGSQSGISLGDLHDGFTKMCLDNHDCLDSLVAAVGAAMWVQSQRDFRIPDCKRTVAQVTVGSPRLPRVSPEVKDMVEVDAARMEGWIYAPIPDTSN